MAVEIKKIKNNQYIVRCNEQDIGTITTYHNEFHNKYLYLKFNLTKYLTSRLMKLNKPKVNPFK